MSTWTKEPPLPRDRINVGCICCSTACQVAHMDMQIAVGFGSAFVTKDHELVYDENDEMSKSDGVIWSVQDAENAALQDPDHDWRIVKMGPLHGETFQRHDPGRWVCIESNEGFA